jgi:O-antigen/teichoic acid export membrane protein
MNKSFFFALNYVTALASGGIQFLAMTWFARSLAPQDYSHIAWSFALFPQYMLLIDLGLQSELVRRFSNSSTERRAQLRAEALGVRLLIALASLVVFAAQAFTAGIGLAHSLATAAFLLILIPAAFLYTIEAEGFATHQLLKTLLMRLARLVGFSLSLLAHVFVLFRARNLEPRALFILCAAFPLGWFALFAGHTLWLRKKGDKETSLRPSFAWKALKTLVLSGKEYLVAFAVTWVANALFMIGIARQFEVGGLAGYFFAQTLCVPVALALQVLSTMTIAAGTVNKRSWIGAFVGTALYGAVLLFTPLVSLVSKQQFAMDAQLQIPWLIAAQLTTSVGGLLGVRLFAAGHKSIVWKSTLCSIPVFLAFWLVFVLWPELRESIPVACDYLATFAAPSVLLTFATFRKREIF